MQKPKGKSRAKNRKGKSNGGPRFSKRQRDIESVDMRDSKRLPNDSRKPDQRGDVDYHHGADNDWRWYAQSPQLVKDVASIPFGYPVGITLPELNVTNDPTLPAPAVPGILRFNFRPTVGYAEDETSPINVAMRRVYSFVRYANSGAKNYDAPDMMIYLVAVDSALMFLEMMKRAYGLMQDVTAYSRYFPQAAVAAAGFDYSDLQVNLAEFRAYINTYAIKLSQLWIPNSMSYMARHAWMCQGVYTDSNTPKAQVYMYTPQSFFKFSLDEEGAGQLTETYLPSTSMKFSTAVTFGDSLLAPMISNEDFGIMGGDILKAFGANGIVKPEGIAETYQVLPVYNQEVLAQMENATVFSTTPNTPNNVTTVQQTTAVGTGYLVSKPKATVTVDVGSTTTASASIKADIISCLTAPTLVNFHQLEVPPELVMVATRLTNCLDLRDTSAVVQSQGSSSALGINYHYTFPVRTAGSEIISGAFVYHYVNDSINGVILNSEQVEKWMPLYIDVISGASTNKSAAIAAAKVRNIALVSNFDWHFGVYPRVYLRGSGDTVSVATGDLGLPIQDLDNYTFINARNLENFAQTALLSEFSIPAIG